MLLNGTTMLMFAFSQAISTHGRHAADTGSPEAQGVVTVVNCGCIAQCFVRLGFGPNLRGPHAVVQCKTGLMALGLVAALTTRIKHLAGHFKQHRKDSHSR
jgi:ribosomal protein S15P/S13E